MNAVGIICEYNPFHLGHARMLEGLRRQYDAPLVCAMSGNFVQRGDAAVARKHARGEMAVRCGADLVLELPTPWAMASAERFAAGGVALLASTGVVSHLAFGSECGDLTALQAAEAALSQPELMPRIRQLLAQGMAYAPARQQAAEELGAPPQMLSHPNDILAIEYLKALRRQKAPMEPLAVLRQGLRLLSADAAALRPYRRGSLLPPCSCGAGAAAGAGAGTGPGRPLLLPPGHFSPAAAAAGGGLPPL